MSSINPNSKSNKGGKATKSAGTKSVKSTEKFKKKSKDKTATSPKKNVKRAQSKDKTAPKKSGKAAPAASKIQVVSSVDKVSASKSRVKSALQVSRKKSSGNSRTRSAVIKPNGMKSSFVKSYRDFFDIEVTGSSTGKKQGRKKFPLLQLAPTRRHSHRRNQGSKSQVKRSKGSPKKLKTTSKDKTAILPKKSPIRTQSFVNQVNSKDKNVAPKKSKATPATSKIATKKSPVPGSTVKATSQTALPRKNSSKECGETMKRSF